MNLGIIFSYVIAGFMMIMITTIGYNTSFSGSELTLQQMQKQKSSDVIEMITYDLPKIGYNRDQLPDTLLREIGDHYIEFYSNIDNSMDGSLELVRWEFTSDSVTSTDNPDDYVLRRSVNGSISETTNISAGVTGFQFRFYTELGSNSPVTVPLNAVSNKSQIDDIVQLEIEMITESSLAVQYSSQTDARYLKSSWTKRFSPVNLRDF